MIDSHRFVPWLLSVGMCLVIISTEMYAPSMPAMVREFMATEAEIQWTIGINAFGFCLASPFVGPLADAYGRRLILQISLLAFCLCVMGCALSPTLFIFDAFRFFQGLFSASLPIVSMAMINDMMQGRQMARVVSSMGVVITMSLALGPIIGGFVGEAYGWRPLFWGTAVVGGVILIGYKKILPETLKKKHPISLRSMKENYKAMINDRIFLCYAMITASILAALFAYITTSSYLYIDVYGMGKKEFGLITGTGMFANAFTNMFSGRLVDRFGDQRILRAGVTCVALAVFLMTIFTFVGIDSPYVLVAPIVLLNMSLAFCFPTSVPMALARFSYIAATASAFLATFRMFSLGASTYIAGYAYNGTLASISSLLILFGSITVIVYLWVRALKAKEEAKEAQAA